MAGKSKLPPLLLSEQENKELEILRNSRAAPVRAVERAQIMLLFHAGNNPSAIQRSLNVSRVTIYNCLHKALEMGVQAGLKDTFHRPGGPTRLTMSLFPLGEQGSSFQQVALIPR